VTGGTGTCGYEKKIAGPRKSLEEGGESQGEKRGATSHVETVEIPELGKKRTEGLTARRGDIIIEGNRRRSRNDGGRIRAPRGRLIKTR